MQHILSVLTNIFVAGEYHCGPNEFLCLSGDECITLIQRCDNYEDCRDHSDELDCSLSSDFIFSRKKRGNLLLTKSLLIRHLSQMIHFL
jgi:hypothetical protein